MRKKFGELKDGDTVFSVEWFDGSYKINWQTVTVLGNRKDSIVICTRGGVILSNFDNLWLDSEKSCRHWVSDFPKHQLALVTTIEEAKEKWLEFMQMYMSSKVDELRKVTEEFTDIDNRIKWFKENSANFYIK
jgi:hypothetical protein